MANYENLNFWILIWSIWTTRGRTGRYFNTRNQTRKALKGITEPAALQASRQIQFGQMTQRLAAWYLSTCFKMAAADLGFCGD